ncbi:SPL family radical SAM protein [Cohnella hongkongensis]|uniref:Radical SAM protein n=1 Tax=Cohnella hongkongensis TaxID=178337 RepID=A0ABV9F5D1_9BACL
MRTTVQFRLPKTLLNKGTGFLGGYTHTLNPYAGCAFGCSYCYVRQMPVSLFREDEWGSWVDVKREADALLRKELGKAKAKGPVTIFMSSSTDPYQPVEHRERVTRALLEVMADEPPDFLLVQTRSSLVTRDIDLFRRLGDRVRISMTIETDREDIRKAFTPYAPPIPARLKALRELSEAGIPTQAAVAPVLPSTERLPEWLAQVTDRVCVDDYFMGDGSGGKRTRNLRIHTLYDELNLAEWNDPSAHRIVLERLNRTFPADRVRISREGFEP